MGRKVGHRGPGKLSMETFTKNVDKTRQQRGDRWHCGQWWRCRFKGGRNGEGQDRVFTVNAFCVQPQKVQIPWSERRGGIKRRKHRLIMGSWGPSYGSKIILAQGPEASP